MTTAATMVRANDTTSDWWQDLCGDLDRRARRRIHALGSEFVFEPGAVIVAEGSKADRFSLIVHGEVAIEVDGKVVNTLHAGDFFGEVALLYTPSTTANAPETLARTATVRATRTTRVHQLDRAELMTVMDAAPAAATRISRRAIGRLALMRGQ